MDEPVGPDPAPSPAEPVRPPAEASTPPPEPPVERAVRAADEGAHPGPAVARALRGTAHRSAEPPRRSCRSRVRSSCSPSSISGARRSARSSSASSLPTFSICRSSGWPGSACPAGCRSCSSMRSCVVVTAQALSIVLRPLGDGARDVHPRVPDRSRPRSPTCTPTSTCRRRSARRSTAGSSTLGQGVGGIDPSALLPVVTGIAGIVGSIVGYIIIPVWIFYLIKDRPALAAAAERSMPAEWWPDARAVSGLVLRVFGQWLRGQLFLGITVGVATFVGLLLPERDDRSCLRAVCAAPFDHRRGPRAPADHRPDHRRDSGRAPRPDWRDRRGRSPRSSSTPSSSSSRTTSSCRRSRVTPWSSTRAP